MKDPNYLSISHKTETFSYNKVLMDRLTIKPDTITIDDYVINYSQDVKCFLTEGLSCFMLGDIYGYGSHHDILSAYHDASKVRDFDGFFTLVFISKRGLKVVSDQFCSYPVFYLKGSSILSSHVYEIASFIKSDPNIDELHYYISAKNNLPGNTIYKDIFALRHETELEINLNSFDERSYSSEQDFIDHDYPVTNIASDLINIVEKGFEYLKSAKSAKKIVCDLSGGADSRITALLAHKCFTEIIINTGVKQTDPSYMQRKEKEIAEKINKKCLGNSKTIERTQSGDIKGDSQFDVLIGGLAGEIFKDFFIKRIFPRKKLYNKGLSDVDLYLLIKTKTLGSNQVVQYMIEHIKSNINFNLRSDKIIDQIYIKYFLSNGNGGYNFQPITTRSLKTWRPYLSNQFILYCRKIDPRHRFHHNIHSNMVHIIDKNCESIELNMPVFGVYPFRNEPVSSANLVHYSFWMTIYNFHRLVLKCYAFVAKSRSRGKIETDKQKDVVDPHLCRIVPELKRLEDETLTILLNQCFDYLRGK